jgi:hypothetical protein
VFDAPPTATPDGSAEGAAEAAARFTHLQDQASRWDRNQPRARRTHGCSVFAARPRTHGAALVAQVTYEKVSQMKYAHAVAQEVLRIAWHSSA